MRFRRLACCLMVVSLVGCTRYTCSRGQCGPFGRKPKASAPTTYAAVPSAPRSPLAIAGAPTSLPAVPPGENPAVPPRSPVAALPTANGSSPEIVQAGGLAPFVAAPEAGSTSPPFRPRKGEPNPADLPSPYAPKGGASGASADPNAKPADANLDPLKKLVQLALTRWAAIDSFETRMLRREVIGGKMTPTDEVLFQFRKQPFSVYMRYVGEAGNGREVLYVQGRNDDKMQIVTGSGDGIKGLKVSRSPDDPKVRERSRHSIREAGFDRTLGAFAQQLELLESGRLPPGTIRYVGPTRRPEFGDRPLECAVRTVSQKDDPTLNGGGAWTLWFDASPESPSYGLPVLLILQDARGSEIEYICYDKFRGPLKLGDADFDPARLGKKR